MAEGGDAASWGGEGCCDEVGKTVFRASEKKCMMTRCWLWDSLRVDNGLVG